MKLLFNNTDFYVIIGANPFDNIEGVAACVIEYVVHLDTTVLRNALAKVGAIVEISFDSDNVDSAGNETAINDFIAEPEVNKRLTLKSTGKGKLDTNDNDRLHLQWLKAFDNILRPESIQYWRSKINDTKESYEQKY